MRVGIDALPLMGSGGISRHLQDLLPALASRGSEHRYCLFARVFRPVQRARYREARQTFSGPNLCWHRVPLPDRFLEWMWTHHNFVLPGTRRYLKDLDVFLATTGLAPSGAPCPVVGIVHDVAPLKFPQWFSGDVALVRLRLEKLVSRSRLLIAVSESTRHDLHEYLGVPLEKVRVVHHGIHPRFGRPRDEHIAQVLADKAISPPFFLYVGGLGPIKNLSTLLRSFRLFRDNSSKPYRLYVAGSLKWVGSLTSEIERLGLSDDVGLLGFLEDQELTAVYAAASAVVLPSWHESFGFPALEAMACMTPVLAARSGALPQLLGDAALFFPPHAPEELAELLGRIVTQDHIRSHLLTLGRARAAQFTWERAAAATLDVLREAME